MVFNIIQKDSQKRLPEKPGVYCFLAKNNSCLYIGKASNLKKRVKEHFQKQNFKESLFLKETEKIGYLATDSEIEALLLEAKLIKEKKPKYNVLWRDDKNYFYVAISLEPFSRVYLTHQKTLDSKTKFLGPYVDGTALKIALRTLRKIFPYYTVKKHPQKECSWCRLGLCPGPQPHKKEYQQNIKNLINVLKGKKIKEIIKSLENKMKKFAQKKDFENAAKVRDQIFALKKVFENAKIIEKPKKSNFEKIQEDFQKYLGIPKIERIEAYDISNLQGKEATGAMVLFEKAAPAKNLYRKFKIKIAGKPNDYAMLKEVLQRRLKHQEWSLPDLILIDGGKGQLSAALKILQKFKKNIPVVSLAKKRNELYLPNKKNPILLKNLPPSIFQTLIQVRDEAHRFAISYHRQLRIKKTLTLA
jgi:excinuclease ABC subunit C